MLDHNIWLEFAFDDLQAAKILINGDYPLIRPALVLAQQAAEKALKAYLLYSNKPLIKTHDLLRLVNMCEKIDCDFKQLIEFAAELTPHCSTSRYPDSAFCITDKTTAIMLLNQAEFILNFIRNKID